jgi:hypothetical protein
LGILMRKRCGFWMTRDGFAGTKRKCKRCA